MIRQTMTKFFDALIASNYFDHQVGSYGVCESFHALVFLTGDVAYKMRKPSRLEGIVDYSTPELRGELLRKELEINSVFPHDIYRGVIPVYRSASGVLNREGHGELVEHLLVMNEMPEESLMSNYLEDGRSLSQDDMALLARSVALFHGSAKEVRNGYAERHRRESQKIIRPFKAHSKTAADEGVLANMDALLTRIEGTLTEREQAGRVRDIHGDLRFCNVFFHNGTIYIYDRIEFDDNLRHQDVALDVAATVTDLLAYERSDLASAYIRLYCSESGDAGVCDVLPYFVVLKAMLSAVIAFELMNSSAGSLCDEYKVQGDRFLCVAHRINTGTDVDNILGT